MNNSVHIDIEKIRECEETLSSVENLVNYRDLSSNFEELEEYFKKINFEHSYCIYYKDALSRIYENLEDVKRKINELTDSLRKTRSSYANINTLSEKDIKELSEIYNSTRASEELLKLGNANSLQTSLKTALQGITGESNDNVTVIPPVETPAPEPAPSSPINTVPIGLAIATTGIAGSVGAVLVNEKYGDLDDELEEYVDDEEIEPIERKMPTPPKERKIEDHIEPYKAVRHNREADKFYGSEFQDIILADDDEEKFDDDFYE